MPTSIIVACVLWGYPTFFSDGLWGNFWESGERDLTGNINLSSSRTKGKAMSIKREILVYLHKFWNAKIIYNMKSILHEYSGIGVKKNRKLRLSSAWSTNWVPG